MFTDTNVEALEKSVFTILRHCRPNLRQINILAMKDQSILSQALSKSIFKKRAY